MQPGDRVLIIGASGGCGTAAVQLAKMMGAAEIVGVCSGRNAELVKSLGATDVVDYTKETVAQHCSNGDETVEEGRNFDVIFDTATGSSGGENYTDSSVVLLKNDGERHGQYVVINGAPLIGDPANQHLITMRCNSKDLSDLAKLIDDNGIKPVIGESLVFNEGNLKKGFDLLRSRRAVGKIVFNMSGLES